MSEYGDRRLRRAMMISMSVDNVVLSAGVPLGATLREFLQAAGCDAIEGPLSDGKRLISLDLELAHRHRDANLSTELPAALVKETSALLVDELLVLAEKP